MYKVQGRGSNEQHVWDITSGGYEREVKCVQIACCIVAVNNLMIMLHIITMCLIEVGIGMAVTISPTGPVLANHLMNITQHIHQGCLYCKFHEMECVGIME